MSRLPRRHGLLLTIVIVALFALATSVALAATINGGNGNDVLNGTAAADSMDGGNGNDTIHGLDGNDQLAGANGNDQIYGDAGDDQITGDNGDDKLYGGDGQDTLSGGNGNDQLDGGAGNDIVMGNLGNDQLTGGTGSDELIADKDTSTMNAGDGNDVIAPGMGAGAITGGAGGDIVADSAQTSSIDAGDGNDVVLATSHSGSLTVNGGAGTDVCYGRTTDTFVGCETIVKLSATSGSSPTLTLTGAPVEGSTITSSSLSVGIQVSAGATTYCMTDVSAGPVACSGTFNATGLAAGPHTMAVAAVGPNLKAATVIYRRFNVLASASAQVAGAASAAADQLTISGTSLGLIDSVRLTTLNGQTFVYALTSPKVTATATSITVSDLNLGNEDIIKVEGLSAGVVKTSQTISPAVHIVSSIDLQVATSPAAQTLTVQGAHLDSLDYLVLVHSGGTLTINLRDADVTRTASSITVSRAALGGLQLSQIQAVIAIDRMEVVDTLDVNITIAVLDNTPPALTLPTGLIAEATSSAGAAVTYSASATDAVDGVRPVSCSNASGSTFALGLTTVSCSASDTHGNIATASFTVHVVDTTAPALTLPGDVTARTTDPSGTVVTFSATAADSVDGSRAVACSPASGSKFAPGTTFVSCTASDTRGNSVTGQVIVTVNLAAGSSTLPSSAGGAVTVDGPNGPVGWSLDSAPAGLTARALPDGISFDGAPISVTYHANDTVTKETIRVSASQGTRTYSWHLIHGPAVTPVLTDDGGAQIGEVQILPPVVLDGAGNVIDGGAFALNGDTLSLTLDDSAYPTPYVIDPTALYDTYMYPMADQLGPAAPGLGYERFVAHKSPPSTALDGTGTILNTYTNTGVSTCTVVGPCAAKAIVSGSTTGSATANTLGSTVTVAEGRNGWILQGMSGKTLPPTLAASNAVAIKMRTTGGDGNLTAKVSYRFYKVQRNATTGDVTSSVALGSAPSTATATGLVSLGSLITPSGGTDLSGSSYADRSFGPNDELLLLANLTATRSSTAALTLQMYLGSVTTVMQFAKTTPPQIRNVTNPATVGLEAAVPNNGTSSNGDNTIKWQNTGGPLEDIGGVGVKWTCKLNGAPYAPCNPAGTTVTGIATGSTATFAVHAENSASVLGTWADGTSIIANTWDAQTTWTSSSDPIPYWVSFKDSNGTSIAFTGPAGNDAGITSVGDGTVVPVVGNNGGAATSTYCQLDGSNVTNAAGDGCDAASFVGLSDGVHYIQIQMAGPSSSPSLDRAIEIRRAPEASITWYSGPVVQTGAANFFAINWGPVSPDYNGTFHADCAEDGSTAFSQCYDTYTGIANAATAGAHSVTVRLTRDGVGTPSYATYSYTAVTAPNLQWNAGSETTSKTGPNVTLSYHNDGGSYDAIYCYIDNNYRQDAACASPLNLTGLTEGNHSVSIYAYNNSAPYGSSYLELNFYVNVAPVATITTNWGNRIADNGSDLALISAGPASTLTAAECRISPDTVWHECAGGIYSNGSTYEVVSNQTAGTHTLDVRLTNNAGVSTKSFTFTSVAAPDIAWLSTPSATAAASSVTLTWKNNGAAPQSSPLTVTCDLDGNARPAAQCASPINITGLAGGLHSVTLTVTDEFNRNSSIYVQFYVVPVPGMVITNPAVANNGSTTATSGYLQLDTSPASPADLTSLQCSLDGALRACSNPSSLTDSYTGLLPGLHTFTAQAKSVNGTSPLVTYKWTVVTPVSMQMQASWKDAEAGNLDSLFADVHNGLTDVPQSLVQQYVSTYTAYDQPFVTDSTVNFKWETTGTVTAQTCTLYSNPSGATLTSPVAKSCPYVAGAAPAPQQLTLTGLANGRYAMKMEVTNGTAATDGTSSQTVYFMVAAPGQKVTAAGPIALRSGAGINDYRLPITIPGSTQYVFCGVDIGIARPDDTFGGSDGPSDGNEQKCDASGMSLDNLAYGKHVVSIWSTGPSAGSGIELTRSDINITRTNPCPSGGATGSVPVLNRVQFTGYRDFTMNAANCSSVDLASGISDVANANSTYVLRNVTDPNKLAFVDPNVNEIGAINADGTNAKFVDFVSGDTTGVFFDYYVGNKLYINSWDGVASSGDQTMTTLTEYTLNAANDVTATRVLFDPTTRIGNDRVTRIADIDRDGLHAVFYFQDATSGHQRECYGLLSDITQCVNMPSVAGFSGVQYNQPLVNGVLYYAQPISQSNAPVYRLVIATGQVTQIAAGAAVEGDLALSPDGTKIAWLSPSNIGNAPLKLMVANADGTGTPYAAMTIDLAPGGAYGVGSYSISGIGRSQLVNWSPNGTRIVVPMNYLYSTNNYSLEMKSVPITGTAGAISTFYPDGFLPHP